LDLIKYVIQEALANNGLLKQATLIPTRTAAYASTQSHAQINTYH